VEQGRGARADGRVGGLGGEETKGDAKIIGGAKRVFRWCHREFIGDLTGPIDHRCVVGYFSIIKSVGCIRAAECRCRRLAAAYPRLLDFFILKVRLIGLPTYFYFLKNKNQLKEFALSKSHGQK
jgi:hypothetical protein